MFALPKFAWLGDVCVAAIACLFSMVTANA